MKLDPPQEREGQEGEKEEFNFGEGIPSKTQNDISPSARMTQRVERSKQRDHWL